MSDLMLNVNEDQRWIAFGTAVKALDDTGRVGGHLVLWGSPEARDLYQEYFTDETEFHLDWYTERPALYQHGLDPSLGARKVGVIDTLKADEVGLWMEAQLELADEYERAIMELVKRGKIRLSSGSSPNLVQIENGKILVWPIQEGSLTPTPAEFRMRPVMPLKALTELPGLEELLDAAKEADGDDETPAEEPPAPEPVEPNIKSITGVKDMTPEMEQQLLAAFVAALEAEGVTLTDEQRTRLQERFAAEAQNMTVGDANAVQSYMADEDQTKDAPDAVVKTMTTLRKLAQDLLKPAPVAPHNGLMGAAKSALSEPVSRVPGYNGNGQKSAPQITDMKDLRYDHLSAADLVFGAKFMPFMRLADDKEVSLQPSEPMLRAAAFKLARAIDLDGNKPEDQRRYRNSIKSALKADEIMATNLANSGQSWVGVGYEDQVWEKVRTEVIWQQLVAKGIMQVEFPPGTNAVDMPTEGNAPTAYSLAELNDLGTDERPPVVAKTSTPTAPKRQLTAGFVGVRVVFSDVQSEDSLIAMLPFLRQQNEIVMQEAIEDVILNGDTAVGANTNINLIDDTPSQDAKGRGPTYLAYNGILKQALVTTTAMSRDAGATFDETDYRLTRSLLSKKERKNVNQLLFIVDADTFDATLDIPAIKTRDVHSKPTLENGVVLSMWGVDVLQSGILELANSAGKIPAAGGSLGRIICLRPDRWGMGWKRRITTESERDIDAQATIVVSTMRFGIRSQADDSGVGVSFNIAI